MNPKVSHLLSTQKQLLILQTLKNSTTQSDNLGTALRIAGESKLQQEMEYLKDPRSEKFKVIPRYDKYDRDFNEAVNEYLERRK